METQIAENRNYLAEFQSKLKVSKNQYNDFGKYKYRSAEDIVEAIKPIINPEGFSLILTDEIVLIGNRFYVKSTATVEKEPTLIAGGYKYQSIGYAREEETKKGMDGSQITGAASSYARKYALNGLFAIDDTKDSYATNEHGNKASEPVKESAKQALKPESEVWAKAVKYISEGWDIGSITKKYTLSKSDQEKLIEDATTLIKEQQ